jgi:hypothetical protein
VDGMSHPLGLLWARLHRFDAFGGLMIFLGCLLHVLSIMALGQGDLCVLVPGFFWCDDAFCHHVSASSSDCHLLRRASVSCHCRGWL